MNFRSYLKDYKEFRDYYMPAQIVRFVEGSLAVVLFGLVSLWLTSETKVFNFISETEDLVDLYTTATFTFGLGAVLAFIGRFIRIFTDRKSVIHTYYDVIMFISVFLYMKWGLHATYLVMMEGREGDAIIWATVYAGIGCFMYIGPIHYVVLVALNLYLAFEVLPIYTGGIHIAEDTRYNMVIFTIIMSIWVLMKYIYGVRGFKGARRIELSRLEKVGFLRNISAELSQALQNMSVRSDFLMGEAKSDELKEAVKQMDAQIDVLMKTADDIADMARIEAGIITPPVAPYKTKKLLDNVIAKAGTYVSGKGLTFKHEISSSVPTVLRGDENRIRQVIMRLVVNATKYTQEGSITLKVDFDRDEQLRGKLKICVSDTGIGIKEEELKELTAKFGRMKDERTGKIAGVNLGLTTAVGIVYALNGQINVTSTYKRGTDISFEVEQEIVSTTVLESHEADDSDAGK